MNYQQSIGNFIPTD